MITTIVKIEFAHAEYYQIVKFIERSSFDTFKELTVHKTSDETYAMQDSVLKVLRKVVDSIGVEHLYLDLDVSESLE